MGLDAKLRVSIRPSAVTRRSLPLDVGSPALLMFMTGCRVGIARLLPVSLLFGSSKGNLVLW
jgi:hypothetical protein